MYIYYIVKHDRLGCKHLSGVIWTHRVQLEPTRGQLWPVSAFNSVDLRTTMKKNII